MQHLSVAVLAGFGALNAPGEAMQPAEGAVTVIRPGACSAQTGFVSVEVANAGASSAASTNGVTVLRYRRATRDDRGWAAQRLLQRYDFQTGEGGVRIVNASPFCVEER